MEQEKTKAAGQEPPSAALAGEALPGPSEPTSLAAPAPSELEEPERKSEEEKKKDYKKSLYQPNSTYLSVIMFVVSYL